MNAQVFQLQPIRPSAVKLGLVSILCRQREIRVEVLLSLWNMAGVFTEVLVGGTPIYSGFKTINPKLCHPDFASVQIDAIIPFST